jgi:hypothetical protein
MNQWQKIETFDFPNFDKKLGYNHSRPVLLFENPNTRIGYYSFTSKGQGKWQSIDRYAIRPSHWMELPGPPKEDDG